MGKPIKSSRSSSISDLMRSKNCGFLFLFILQEWANGVRYPLVGGTRQRRFDGTNFKPGKLLENAATPTSRVHAVLARSLCCKSWLELFRPEAVPHPCQAESERCITQEDDDMQSLNQLKNLLKCRRRKSLPKKGNFTQEEEYHPDHHQQTRPTWQYSCAHRGEAK